MRAFGIVLLFIGVAWVIAAFNLPTSIHAPEQKIGSGEFQISIPSTEIYNLDLANRRQTHLIVSGLMVIVGSIFMPLLNFEWVMMRGAGGPRPGSRAGCGSIAVRRSGPLGLESGDTLSMAGCSEVVHPAMQTSAAIAEPGRG
jgi:hypothetical protein